MEKWWVVWEFGCGSWVGPIILCHTHTRAHKEVARHLVVVVVAVAVVARKYQIKTKTKNKFNEF